MSVATNQIRDLYVRRALNYLSSAADGNFTFTSFNDIEDLELRRIMTAMRNKIVSGKGGIPSTDRIEDLEVRRVLNSIISKIKEK